ncbi:MAG: UDP-N-acetylglucosamine 1-carboxyvinyltransferase [Lachnospiraceae bacterium]|nr:UDP-N-acetylglucosamine 1-carboxyvinyltransferase [Lachnospiraceae bacterium]MBQ8549000.1 UDP-N-acetylglucosamine 1-carboxyvinyltransferase [Lachnospiraceae bacterium]
MEQYMIKGGKPLVGEVTIGGAKNAALGVVAAAIMTDEPVRIHNIPDISDVDILLKGIEALGAVVERPNVHEARMIGGSITTCIASYDDLRKIRGSYYLCGAMLGKYKRAEVPLPGGCNIGSRPIDQHIKGFEALGAKVVIQHGMIIAEAEKLVGAHIYFDCSSVGATINVMMAACMAEGQTVLENAAKEPHVVEVANFLNSLGANIKGAGTDVIRIAGVESLHGSTYSIIPDQIEAGTFMLAAAATKGDVLIKNVIPKHLEAVTAKLVEIGAEVEEFDDAVRVVAPRRLVHTNIKTLPYPGFPTDMQQVMATLLCMAEGTSIVTETIYENRFMYVDELTRMGANMRVVEGNSAVIEGVEKLTGAIVRALDLRCGAALVIAGLMADGYTTVEHIEYVERGYEKFVQKMCELGAAIEKVDSEDAKAIQKFKLRVG